MTVLFKHWPRLEGQICFVEDRMENAEVPDDGLLASVHACGTLTDRVLPVRNI